MERIAILDCDGTLLNWRHHFETWAYKNNLIEKTDPESGVFISKHPNLSIKTIIDLFNETIHISKLPAESGAVDGVKRLISEGWTLKICSSFSSNYQSMRLREQNITNIFGPVFSEYMFLPFVDIQHSTEKIKYIEEQQPEINQVILFEDNPWVIKSAIEAGLDPTSCYLITQTYNEPFAQELKEKGVNIGRWRQFIY